MKREDNILIRNLEVIMKEAQVEAAPPPAPVQMKEDDRSEAINTPVATPLDSIATSAKSIRSFLKKAELGDKTAISKIESELNAIERALNGASKTMV